MGLFRQRPSANTAAATAGGGTSNQKQKKNRPNIGTKLILILSLYLIWASYTLSTNPGLKSKLKGALQRRLKLLQEGNLHEFLFLGSDRSSSSPSSVSVSGYSSSSTTKVPVVPGTTDTAGAGANTIADTSAAAYRRIPCGLIVIIDDAAIAAATKNDDGEEEEEDVLPLSTMAAMNHHPNKGEGETGIPGTGTGTGMAGITGEDGISTLHARALKRYPQLQHHIQRVQRSTSTSTSTTAYDIIPAGTFRLRMGSMEATIEKSPELRIIHDDDDDDDNNDDGEFDLRLGSIFWNDHFAEFGDDELYMSTMTTSSATTTSTTTTTATEAKNQNRNRVMVPYLSMRSSRGSFNIVNNNNNEL